MTATPEPARPEIGLPIESLLQLHRSGPGDVSRLARLALRGDWRTRTLALSALGRLMRGAPDLRRRDSLRQVIASRLPGLRHRDRALGLRGLFVRDIVANALTDRSWIVRAAAVLALGEGGSAETAARLRPLLRDSHRTVRIATAAALLAARVEPEVTEPALLANAEPAPERIGDTESSLEWLARLASAHADVLARFRPCVAAPAPEDSNAWARYLAGELRREPADARQAEILRYAQAKETHYNFTKPFTRIDRAQNIRHLLAFLTVAENLRVPQDGRILDLGGGAGWVSELLAKFGYRPITLDISTALIRVGCDRFRRENLPARFTAGDMTALPIRTGSMDAVVVVDALHHVPDVPAVFREAYRVLAPGGQFLLAEPGEGHAETEKSREELNDHGVCEREIHLREAVDYGRRAGFDRIRVIPHFVPAVEMSPEEFDQAMVTPSERWTVRQNDHPVSFDEFVIQSSLNHPILSFRKGERPLDSRMPRDLRARLDPRLHRDGARVSGHVTVTNEGDTLWLPGADESGRVRLGIQLLTPERKLLDLDFARAPLTGELAPGRTADLPVDVRLPDATSPYVLKLDMVDEHICWFEDVGGKPVYVPVS
jgi:ubiquinone/menaquinone biosynthesis C-methylase UbiE